MVERELGSYEELAKEYYDPVRHPTCANFREASEIVLRTWLPLLSDRSGVSCEVGAGKSLFAEVLEKKPESLSNLVLLDSSPSMLRHSKVWIRRGVRLIVGDVLDIPLVDGSAGTLISVLGDPYDLPRFWSEAARVLRKNGAAVFTTPSHTWSRSFRASGAGQHCAEFVLSNGQTVEVPSYIRRITEQVELIERFGLAVISVREVTRKEIKQSPLSPKLDGHRAPETPVVTAYLLRRR